MLGGSSNGLSSTHHVSCICGMGPYTSLHPLLGFLVYLQIVSVIQLDLLSQQEVNVTKCQASAHVKQMLVVFNVTDVYQDTTTCPQLTVMDVSHVIVNLGLRKV